MTKQNKTERWVEEFENRFIIKRKLDCGRNTQYTYEFIDELNLARNVIDHISQLLSDARREERERCLEAMEDYIGSGLKLDPLPFVHIGGRKDIYEVALMSKIGDNPMVIPYNLFKVAVEKVVSEQISKAITTAEENIRNLK